MSVTAKRGDSAPLAAVYGGIEQGSVPPRKNEVPV